MTHPILAASSGVELFSMFGSWAAVAVGVAAAIISYKVFREAVDPQVIVYVDWSADPPLLDVVVANTGRGLAKDIRIHLTRHIAIRRKRGDPLAKDGPLERGIAALGPGATRRFLWGHFDEIEAALDHQPVYLTVTCRNARGQDVESLECILEVDSLSSSLFPTSHQKRIAESLREISTHFRRLETEHNLQRWMKRLSPLQSAGSDDEKDVGGEEGEDLATPPSPPHP